MADLEDQWQEDPWQEDPWQEDPESALKQSGSRSGRSENNSGEESSDTDVDIIVEGESTEKESGNDQVATTSSASKKEAGSDYVDLREAIRACDEEFAKKLAKLPPIVKYVYSEDPEVSRMSTSQAAEWRRENFDMQVWRTNHDPSNLKPIPNPVLTFEQAFKNYPEIMEKINRLGLEKPSPIQSQVWPILLGGEDLIVTAPNGSGKTLAYLLPALVHIEGQNRPKKERRDPLVLIVVPTRELAIQVHREICNFINEDIKSVCLYGGKNQNEQIEVIDKGVDIVVATPGRLKGIIDLKHLNAMKFTYIIYDEADKLFDTGLAREVRLALYNARPDHQCILLSATWIPGVKTYIDTVPYIETTIEVVVGSMELAPIHTVTQQILFMQCNEKDTALLTFVTNMSPTDKVIIFCDHRCSASHITSDFAVKGINFSSLYKGLDQEEREEAFDAILQGSTNILVATDMVSRGIDIKDLTHVINYSFPNTPEDYLHRIGRVGRAGKEGKAITYMTKYDWQYADDLIEILKEANEEAANELEMHTQRYEVIQEKERHKEHEMMKFDYYDSDYSDIDSLN